MAKMGVVYVIRNDEHVPNRFKVGQTYDLGKRIGELNRETSNIGTFRTVAAFPVGDAEQAERECHKALSEYSKAKEFFDGPEEAIVAIVERVATNYVPEPFIKDDKKVRQEHIRIEEEEQARLIEAEERTLVRRRLAEEAERKRRVEQEKLLEIEDRLKVKVGEEYDLLCLVIVASVLATFFMGALAATLDDSILGLEFYGVDFLTGTLVVFACAFIGITRAGKKRRYRDLRIKYLRDAGLNEDS